MDDISRLRARPVVIEEPAAGPLEEDLEEGSDEGDEEPEEDPAVWEKLA